MPLACPCAFTLLTAPRPKRGECNIPARKHCFLAELIFRVRIIRYKPDVLGSILDPMDWTPGGRSSDLEDRRGGGGGFGFGGGLGIGGFVIVLLLSLLFHRNFFALLGDSGGQASTTNT